MRPGGSFSTTSRFSSVSRARNPSPMPPTPRALTISYGPEAGTGGEGQAIFVDHSGTAALLTGLVQTPRERSGVSRAGFLGPARLIVGNRRFECARSLGHFDGTRRF